MTISPNPSTAKLQIRINRTRAICLSICDVALATAKVQRVSLPGRMMVRSAIRSGSPRNWLEL